MAGEERRSSPGHQLTLQDGTLLSLTGVRKVETFDDHVIVLDTTIGVLTVRGSNLHIRQLDLETGRFALDGAVQSLVYTPSHRGRSRSGFLSRVMR